MQVLSFKTAPNSNEGSQKYDLEHKGVGSTNGRVHTEDENRWERTVGANDEGYNIR